MYILKPVIHETIWGGNRLNHYVKEYGVKIGHLYLANGHDEMSNEILNGVYAGKILKDVFQTEKRNWNMEEYNEFPLTIALVDASENLSIQVHPDNIDAERLEGIRIGKTESWIFIQEPEKGWIYDGCRCSTKEEIEMAVKENRMEEITARLNIKKNDYVCVKAGTLHAMTEGSLVYEIEYGGDFTYRFYDYNRKDKDGNSRELHIRKAVESIKPDNIPVVRRDIGNQWISEENYEIQKIKDQKEYQNISEGLECFTLLDGEGQEEDCELYNGMTVLLLPGEKLSQIKINQAIIARIIK